jgi:hypothetical protein
VGTTTPRYWRAHAAALLVGWFSTMKLGRPVAQNPVISPAPVVTVQELDLAA